MQNKSSAIHKWHPNQSSSHSRLMKCDAATDTWQLASNPIKSSQMQFSNDRWTKLNYAVNMQLQFINGM
jgi:hypothetical protein